MRDPKEAAAWITGIVKQFAAESELNRLELPSGEAAWREPLVGFSRGDDPLYAWYKESIGDFYWTPEQVFNRVFPDQPAEASELSVISWILPQTDATRRENAGAKVFPSERWARARNQGEAFNQAMRGHVVRSLRSAGIPALAPFQTPGFKWLIESERHTYTSNWSERHAAYAAGLGTFGLCDGLITPAGKAMRTGSAVARIEVEPSERPYTDHHAYCLFYTHGTCGKCIERCPVSALSEAGHNKKKCYRHVEEACPEYTEKNYGFKISACGLCQVGVPCEDHIPTPDEG